MAKQFKEKRSFRGLLQSDDGHISKLLSSNEQTIIFEAVYRFSDELIKRLHYQPQHLLFSERSRIARLGIQITSEPPSIDNLNGDLLVLVQEARPMISGYPGLKELRTFFDIGLPVGRLVFCDPDALLSSEEVLSAIESSAIKLPASTAISSDGSIVIAPHKVIFELHQNINQHAFGRILQHEDGRELLNRYQVPKPVSAVTIPPGKGVITTCSMYLNEHYVVLQSGFALGRNLPATVLDPIKTRGIRIYLEIVNGSEHPIVNPLISAKIYGSPKYRDGDRRKKKGLHTGPYSYKQMQTLNIRLSKTVSPTCHYLDKPIALIPKGTKGLTKVNVYTNGPDKKCPIPPIQCVPARNTLSPESRCAHVYATSKIKISSKGGPDVIVLKYFPNILEHRDIINLVFDGKLDTLYFMEPSCEHGPFLSQLDHHRLQEYNTFGLEVYWICSLTKKLMVHTMRDGKGYFVDLDRLADFHKSMLFAFYGSTLELSAQGIERLGRLMDALIFFWGKNIGIVTGGGSGVMEMANRLARERGILSGANFLDITDQRMTTEVDFCQVFQSTCRHSRQKWFEVASFPIFNVGGLGSLEELGITLCNMKLSIMERVPVILFDTEGNAGFWDDMQYQIKTMVTRGRAPAWILDNIVITDDPEIVVNVYRQRLQLF
jgi:predicted Rossmann-fold nucleotide-binding protein